MDRSHQPNRAQLPKDTSAFIDVLSPMSKRRLRAGSEHLTGFVELETRAARMELRSVSITEIAEEV